MQEGSLRTDFLPRDPAVRELRDAGLIELTMSCTGGFSDGSNQGSIWHITAAGRTALTHARASEDRT
jgi:hypothetical protein